MSLYYVHFAGLDRDAVGVECASPIDARIVAIKQLGRHLEAFPSYAVDGHWRVTVEDESRRPIFTIAVATVAARGGDTPRRGARPTGIDHHDRI